MEIVKGDNLILHSVAQEVLHGEDVSQLVSDMWATLRTTTGVGLAANQVGILKRVIIVNDTNFISEIINPVITQRMGKVKQSTEGCLSFPLKTRTIKRDSVVVIEGFDVNWNPIKKKCRGLLANIVQHEVDHLNGITIVGSK